MNRALVLLMVLFLPLVGLSDEGSIAALQLKTKSRAVKTIPTVYDAGINTVQVERLQYRTYFILLNGTSNGQYELQVYKLVRYGNKQVNSIFASQFESSVEYAYSYEASGDRIRRDHFLYPPDSLTGWANPTDYVTLKEFVWKEPFPAKNCTRNVYTSEEYNREYLEASCFRDRDSALRFGKKFVDYVLGNRGM
jgi:hypothetical protein